MRLHLVSPQDLDIRDRCSRELLEPLIRAHNATVKILLSEEAISKHGLYRIDRSWLLRGMDIIEDSLAEEGLSMLPAAIHQPSTGMFASRAARAACSIYCGAVRSATLADELRAAVGKALGVEAAVADDSMPTGPASESPFVLEVWRFVLSKLSAGKDGIPEPVLVTGAVGGGKSEALSALAFLLGRPVHQLFLTAETEPSLVGESSPAEKRAPGDSPIRWVDGGVTMAFSRGEWCVLDNVNEAPATCLERLLEQKPVLLLSERGDTDPGPRRGFALLSTMAVGGSHAQPNELSPAAYNRFSIVHMDSFGAEQDRDVKELGLLASRLLGLGDSEVQVAAVAKFCLLVRSSLQQALLVLPEARESLSTLRSLIQLMETTYAYSADGVKLPLGQALLKAFDVAILSQVKAAADANLDGIRDELRQKARAFLRSRFTGDFTYGPEISKLLPTGSDSELEIVVTSSRRPVVEAVLSSTKAGQPVLLEGHPAVGKTSLVVTLARREGFAVERVNNTLDTAPQDYLGSYVPGPKGFQFNDGPLIRALKQGKWLLLDELNLAPPPVISMLTPLLDGAKAVRPPGYPEIILVHPSFRIFATQNPSRLSDRHRLPLALRSRFLEVYVADFPEEEVEQIFLQKCKDESVSIRTEEAARIARSYRELNSSTQLPGCTLRQVIKWIRRKRIFSGASRGAVGLSLFLSPTATPSETRFKVQTDARLLEAGGEVAFELEAFPGTRDEDVEQELVLGLGSSDRLFRLPLLASVRSPRFSIEQPDVGTLEDGGSIRLPAVQPGQVSHTTVVLANKGEVPVDFTWASRSLDRALLRAVPAEGRLAVGQACSIILQGHIPANFLARGETDRQHIERLSLSVRGAKSMDLTARVPVGRPSVQLDPFSELKFDYTAKELREMLGKPLSPAEASLRVTNGGAAALHLCLLPSSQVSLDGSSDQQVVVAPRSTVDLRLCLRSATLAAARGEIFLQTNVLDRPEIRLPWILSVKQPKLLLRPSALIDLGRAKPGDVLGAKLELSSAGGGDPVIAWPQGCSLAPEMPLSLLKRTGDGDSDINMEVEKTVGGKETLFIRVQVPPTQPLGLLSTTLHLTEMSAFEVDDSGIVQNRQHALCLRGEVADAPAAAKMNPHAPSWEPGRRYMLGERLALAAVCSGAVDLDWVEGNSDDSDAQSTDSHASQVQREIEEELWEASAARSSCRALSCQRTLPPLGRSRTVKRRTGPRAPRAKWTFFVQSRGSGLPRRHSARVWRIRTSPGSPLPSSRRPSRTFHSAWASSHPC